MKFIEKIRWKIKKYFRLIRLWESYSGREYGWIVKKDGMVIAELVDFIDFEMFWVSYLIVPKTNDEKILNELKTPDFWYGVGSGKTVVVNKIIKYKTDKLMCTLEKNKKRVSVRGLYIPSRNHNFFDYLLTTFFNLIFKYTPSNFNKKNGYNNWYTSYRKSLISDSERKKEQIDEFYKQNI